jgi:quercetin dioxygenase-like cupin family protein
MSEALSAGVVQWDALPVESPRPGIVRQTLHGDRQTVVRYRYAPGSVFPVHAHPEEQVTIVLRGTLALDVAGEESICGPGTVVVIPGGVLHGTRVLGEQEVETLNTFVPRRTSAP